MPMNLVVDIFLLYVDKLLSVTNSVELAHIFRLTATDDLFSAVFSLPPLLPSGLNSNLNVSLDMGVGGGSGGGAVSYKEPPQSKLKKLWATDPLEQNSKPGKEEAPVVFGANTNRVGVGIKLLRWLKSVEHTSRCIGLLFWFALCDCVFMFVCFGPSGVMSSALRLEVYPFYDFLSPGPSPLSPPGQSMGSVGDGWPPRANSPPPHGNTVTWPPGRLAFKCTNKQNIFCVCRKMLIALCVPFVLMCRVPTRGALERLPQH